MIVVDTNILIYAANKAYEVEHRPCRQFLEDLLQSATPWYLTWSIVYEFLRVTTHHAIHATPVRLAESWSFVNTLLDSDSCIVLVPTARHRDVLDEVVSESPALAGSILHDAHTAVLMREHGIQKICTRDRDFHQFRGLQIIDPLEER